jgi:hypothetical protein
MSTLKQQIQTDLQTLQSLDLDILPARTYYVENLKYFAMLWTGLFGVQLIAVKAINKMGLWQDYFEKHTNHNSAIQAKMWLGCILSSLIISLVMLARVKWYVIFKHQLREHLQTGVLFQRKIRQITALFYGVYFVFLFFWLAFFSPDMTLFAGFGAIVFSFPLCLLLINMELTRVGISVLLGGINRYFNKEKTL